MWAPTCRAHALVTLLSLSSLSLMSMGRAASVRGNLNPDMRHRRGMGGMGMGDSTCDTPYTGSCLDACGYVTTTCCCMETTIPCHSVAMLQCNHYCIVHHHHNWLRDSSSRVHMSCTHLPTPNTHTHTHTRRMDAYARACVTNIPQGTRKNVICLLIACTYIQ